jgi:hypothetical protein
MPRPHSSPLTGEVRLCRDSDEVGEQGEGDSHRYPTALVIPIFVFWYCPGLSRMLDIIGI